MKTSELLTKYPQLTHKKLRGWRDAGYLNPSNRTGEGYKKGGYNEWDDETIPRIELILQHSSKRIDTDRIAIALIAHDYYIGATSLKKIITDKFIPRIRGQQLVDRGDGSVGCGGRTLKHNSLLQAIAVGVLNPAQGQYRDGRPTTRPPSDIKLRDWRQDVTLAVHNLFNIHHLNVEWFDPISNDSISNDELETAFYDSAPFARMFTPIAGTLAGFDYGEIPFICFFHGVLGEIKLSASTNKLEFEATIRILTMLGLIIIGRKREVTAGIRIGLMRYSPLFLPKAGGPGSN